MSPRSRLAVASIALLCFGWLSAQVAQGRTAGFDAQARDAIHASARPALTNMMLGATALGSQAVILGVSAGAMIGLWLGGRRGEARLVLVVIAGAELCLLLIKAFFHRPRPDAFFGVIAPPSYSFPSGHALLSLCCYGTLAALAGARLGSGARRAVRIAAAVLILAIGVSRIYLGVHYPTDVIGGYLVAIAWMAVATLIQKP